MAGTLYVVATPIGNLEDITVRAIKILLTAKVIACEDTRRTGMLLKLLKEKYAYLVGEIALGFKARLISVRDWNEKSMVPVVLDKLSDGDVALVSDSGTPLISDPGFKVVRAAREAGFKVSPIPGPSAVIAALCASGLPTNKFVFWGFLPEKWEFEPGVTHVIYESPVNLKATVREIEWRYPEASVVVAREMTKIHETIGGGENLDGKVRGEVTVLVYVPDKMEKKAVSADQPGEGDCARS